LDGRANNEDEIIASCNVFVSPSHCLANTPLGTIAIMRLAELFADHKAAACMTDAIARGVHNKQRMRPGLSLATHPLKLLWPLQPLATPHAALRLAMTARYSPPLIANRQFPTALEPTCFNHAPTVAGRHAGQKTMLASTRNALRLPCSLGHKSFAPSKTKF
jgi:hypothetical protein